MSKNFLITICSIIGVIGIASLGYLIAEEDLLDDLFSSNNNEVVLTTNGKKEIIKKDNVKKTSTKFHLFGPKVNITKNKAASAEFVPYNNGLFSMKIPKGWTVGVGTSDYIHYSFMVYDPKNPDYKIFFNMKTEGYLKTQQMKNFYAKYYPNAPFVKLPVINPQTTDAFYKVFTQTYNTIQNSLAFKVPVIKNFKTVQVLGKNQTGGQIIRGTYQNEQGKNVEGIFTATIKEFSMPPVVMLMVYNTIFFTAPQNELVDWMPVLNYSLSTIRFSDNFINGYYREQGQVVQNANSIAAICNQTSDIITSGWKERQKTYDTISQKQSDMTLGYDRVRDTETGEIYKAELGFMDKDRNGRFERITDDMYSLPTAGYIEKR